MATTTAATKAEDLAKLINDLKFEISEFDAKKPGELKTLLETADKQLEAAKKDYLKQFETLMQRWSGQHERIMSLRARIQAADPNWKKLIEDRICPFIYRKARQAKYVECRGEAKGAREAARDDALAAQKLAGDKATAWQSAAKQLGAVLDADDKLILQIEDQLESKETGIAIYRLWFKLLPTHVSIRPEFPKDKDGAETGPFQAIVDEIADALCLPMTPDSDRNKCSDYSESADGSTAKYADAPKRWPRGVPYLIDPGRYEAKVIEVVTDYSKAKGAYALKQATYADKPDDLATARQKLKTWTEKLDADIEGCIAATSVGCLS
jgi:hypothetical protein